jgi:hypothetical protein
MLIELLDNLLTHIEFGTLLILFILLLFLLLLLNVCCHVGLVLIFLELV